MAGQKVRLLLFVPPGWCVGEARERYSSPSPSIPRPVLGLGQTLVDGRLEAPHMFHRHVLRLTERRLQVFVESCEYLTVQNLKHCLSVKSVLLSNTFPYLESSDSVDHSLQLNSFNIFVLAIHSLDPDGNIACYQGSDFIYQRIVPEDMIAEVQTLEPSLLG